MAKRHGNEFPQSYRESECWSCGFTPPPTLHMDHWDNDVENNDRSNCRTLCFACHVIKTDYAREDISNAKFVQFVEHVIKENGKDFLRQMMSERNKSGKGRLAWSRNRRSET